MPKALLCFDTEGVTTDGVADAVVEIATICTQEGVSASFMVMGYLARMLALQGRDDVRRALAPHEVHNHTLLHSVHPTINETTDVGSRGEIASAGRLIRIREGHSNRYLRACFGDPALLAACPPGNSKSYVAMYEYAKTGVSAYCDSVVDEAHFCNLLHLDYAMCLEQEMFLHSEGAARNEAAITKAVETARSRHFTIFFAHPDHIFFERHWDDPDYFYGNNVAWGQWTPRNRRPLVETQNFMQGLRRLIRALKASGVTFCTIGDVIRAEATFANRKVARSDCEAILAELRVNFGALSVPCSLCLTDILQAAVRFLLSDTEAFVPGFVYGFLEEPQGVVETRTITRSELKAAAARVDFSTFLPERIEAGKAGRIGPADLLFAALDAVCAPAKTEFLLTPRRQMPSLASQPKLIDCDLGRWINADSWKDEHLSRRLPLQAWTLRGLAQLQYGNPTTNDRCRRTRQDKARPRV